MSASSRQLSVPLGDVATIVRGITFKPSDVVSPAAPDAVVCMRTANVQSKLDETDLIAIPSVFVKRGDQYLRAGDLLVSSANSWNLVGKCCWIPRLQYKAAAGGFVSILRADAAKLNARYLYYWFSSAEVQTTVRSFGRQTTSISNLDISRTLTLEIPLPPLAEQKRIAEILDTAEALREKRRQALSKANELRNSITERAFAETRWATKPLSSCAAVVSGVTKGRQLNGKVVTEVPYLRVANVQAGFLNLAELKSIEATEDEINTLRLAEGDVLLTEGGDFDKLGRGARWKGEIAVCIHQNNVFRVRCDQAEILPEVFEAFLQSSVARRYFLACAKRTTNLASINMTQLKALPVPQIPLPQQRALREKLSKLEQLVAGQGSALEVLNGLNRSLRQRAFQGLI